ncbi:hypothetical protein DSO57_1036187 [Entomophthora muscae]|uniref:Uncharacterized protein n=1 Tax=Entomophthora muscae TaxID=34485 RepID=A0ACC2TXY0_9FUNG|nr:hypothetical protein DSO57_1036187 [Entomophthora muscae]
MQGLFPFGMKTAVLGLFICLSALGVNNEEKLPSFSQINYVNMLSRRDGDNSHAEQHPEDHHEGHHHPEGHHHHEDHHGHSHLLYRKNEGSHMATNNYIGLGVVLIAGVLGSIFTLFGGALSANIRCFTTGVLLSLVFCQMLVAANILLQEETVPHALSHFEPFASSIIMTAMFLAHLFDYANAQSHHKASAYLVYFALMIHSCTFGVFMGMKKDHAIVSFLVSASLQRLLHGMALGMCILDAGFPGRLIPLLLVITFVISCPAATLVGIQLKDTPPNATLIEGIFESVGAGLLIYVVLVALLGRAFSEDYSNSNSTQKFMAFVSLFVGFTTIAILSIWCK